MMAEIARIKLKELLREHNNILYSLILPILLITIVYGYISNTTIDKNSNQIRIGIVYCNELEEFIEYMKSISVVNNNIMVTVVDTKEDIYKLEWELDTIVTYENRLVFTRVKNINTSFVESYIEEYILYKGSSITKDTINNKNSYIILEKENQQSINNNQMIIILSILGIACLSCCRTSYKECMNLDINQSEIARRVYLMSRKYGVLSWINHSLIVLLHYICNMCTLIYVIYLIGLHEFNIIPVVACSCFFLTVIGSLIGILYYQVIHLNNYFKWVLLNLGILCSGFLSGVIYPKLLFYLGSDWKVIQFINPVSLYVNLFYNILWKQNVVKVLFISIILCGWIVILGGIIYFINRRRKYAHNTHIF